MFSAIRKRISPATVVAFMALIFAMTGGAFAASSGGGGSTAAKATASITPLAGAAKAKAKPKAKAGPRGPAGPAGAKGAAGAAGPAGPAGPAGAAGAKGENGAPGATGAQGPQGEKGAAGIKGVPGEKGATGETGFTKTLPSGETETGTWGYGPTASNSSAIETISFVIPVEPAPTLHYLLAEGEDPTDCPGTVEEPTAAPGSMCMYHNEGLTQSLAHPGPHVVSSSGVGMLLIPPSESESASFSLGTWAVTAE